MGASLNMDDEFRWLACAFFLVIAANGFIANAIYEPIFYFLPDQLLARFIVNTLLGIVCAACAVAATQKLELIRLRNRKHEHPSNGYSHPMTTHHPSNGVLNNVSPMHGMKGDLLHNLINTGGEENETGYGFDEGNSNSNNNSYHPSSHHHHQHPPSSHHSVQMYSDQAPSLPALIPADPKAWQRESAHALLNRRPLKK